MAGILPTASFRGVVDYLALAAGIILGFAVISGPMQNITSSLKKN